ncbi:pyruvate kinase [Algoriphagus boseongensis]|uniref:Pyruvate kinase n=1 Tax=Algoriphagus boseongensis TaxID=1442587 RepID=A0A4R6TBP8_9BACT|nr:pyruvate kinase [Algoriphagus boseongensis]TDQ19462.1 pyruvate kinase [Algoriphagus boseongensis]
MNPELLEIKNQLTELEAEMQEVSKKYKDLLGRVDPSQQESAKNLLHYLILRKTPIQELQAQLHRFGLSSLASCESHTLHQIQVTLERLGLDFSASSAVTMEFGSQKIKASSEHLFGSHLQEWPTSVMVTFDKSFLREKDLVRSLLKNGMGVARINCAHDEELIWLQMIKEIRKESRKSGIPCKIHLDLAGPKIRTVLLKKGKESGRVEIDKGEKFWLSDSGEGFSDKDVVVSPNEKGVVEALNVGERVFIDDGLILTRVLKKNKRGALLTVERNSAKKNRLKEEKGINFPDSELKVPALTDFDRACLPFAVEYADTVGFSFVKSPEDLIMLRTEMRKLSDEIPPVILKIETHEAVVNLPELLLEGMKEEFFGVMIARGDLAVEIGFERLVEIQEEISWLCEAAHVPVIWATQVLENLHKFGVASRAEITDAGRAAMAECILINKGNHTLEVLKTLKDIAKRSRALKKKNRLVFRPLKIAEHFFEKIAQHGFS